MFRGGSQRRLERAEGLDLHFGEARFTGTKQVEVTLNDGGVAKLTADNFFINTGTRPSRPDIPGLEDVSTLDNSSIMELDAVPEHLFILGGGYIGIEFGQMFRRFGAQVTLIQTRRQLLPREDADVAEEVANWAAELTKAVATNRNAQRHGPMTASRGRPRIHSQYALKKRWSGAVWTNAEPTRPQ